jgi:recombination protein RecA
MGISAAVLKKEIEAKLAARIPAALSPVAQSFPRLHPSGNPVLDKFLDGGFPLGSLCEVTGPECSGRSAIGLALLASASREGVCAYIDASDTCSPSSAAAAGVVLRNLLWVRFGSSLKIVPPAASRVSSVPLRDEREQQQLSQPHCGGSHPRGETKGLAPALEQMLFDKEERRRRKMEGTPGYPNQPMGLSEASPDQVEWEQFNSRKVDDRDPLRQSDRAAAEAARQRSAVTAPAVSCCDTEKKPWTVLDRALRATDQVLQAGGFRVVVLDIASLSPLQTQRIQSATWWRFQKAAKLSDTVFLVLSQAPCARSSAACVVECSAGELPRVDGVLSSTQHIAQVSRQRTGPVLGKKAPGRVTSWRTAPAWMRAVGS